MGNLFIFVVFAVIAFIYFAFVGIAYGPIALKSNFSKVILGFYHIILVFLGWSLLATMFTDPG